MNKDARAKITNNPRNALYVARSKYAPLRQTKGCLDAKANTKAIRPQKEIRGGSVQKIPECSEV
jgi:hypothetical protein